MIRNLNFIQVMILKTHCVVFAKKDQSMNVLSKKDLFLKQSRRCLCDAILYIV